MRNTRQYDTWSNMRSRCDNEKNTNYSYYGGRGIIYQKSWSKFESFWEDMKVGYADNLELDRIDPNQGYSKENCRWTTSSVQSYNRNIQSSNKSGKVGVFYNQKINKWMVRISKDNIPYYLGSYSCFEEACNVRDCAEIEYYGFNVNTTTVLE